jgi:hypothetical protein
VSLNVHPRGAYEFPTSVRYGRNPPEGCQAVSVVTVGEPAPTALILDMSDPDLEDDRLAG